MINEDIIYFSKREGQYYVASNNYVYFKATRICRQNCHRFFPSDFCLNFAPNR